MMSKVWTVLIGVAVVFGALSGRMDKVSEAAVSGAMEAVELMIAVAGMMCLWSGIMKVMSESGLAEKIALLFRPILKKLFRESSKDAAAIEYISGNMTANLLGLSNAATPIGLAAAKRMKEIGRKDSITDEIITFIVINTASLQLIPTTVAAVRASLGSCAPYDILPSVWLSSAISIVSGLSAVFVFRKLWHRKEDGALE